MANLRPEQERFFSRLVDSDVTGENTSLEVMTKDHPEANGRHPKIGEQQWTITMPLADGTQLLIHMGKKSRDLLFGMLVAEEIEDEIAQREKST